MMCERSEIELLLAEKWVKEQLLLIADTKRNFNYVFSKLKLLESQVKPGDKFEETRLPDSVLDHS